MPVNQHVEQGHLTLGQNQRKARFCFTKSIFLLGEAFGT